MGVESCGRTEREGSQKHGESASDPVLYFADWDELYRKRSPRQQVEWEEYLESIVSMLSVHAELEMDLRLLAPHQKPVKQSW